MAAKLTDSQQIDEFSPYSGTGLKNDVDVLDYMTLTEHFRGYPEKKVSAKERAKQDKELLKVLKAQPQKLKYDHFVNYSGNKVRRVWVPLLDVAMTKWAAFNALPTTIEANKLEKYNAEQKIFMNHCDDLQDLLSSIELIGPGNSDPPSAYEAIPWMKDGKGALLNKSLQQLIANDPPDTKEVKAIARVLGCKPIKVWQALYRSYLALLLTGKPLSAQDAAKIMTDKPLPKIPPQEVAKAAKTAADPSKQGKVSWNKPSAYGPNAAGSSLDSGAVGMIAVGLIGVGLVYWLTQKRGRTAEA